MARYLNVFWHVCGLKSRMHLVVSFVHIAHVTRFSVQRYSTQNNQIVKILVLYVFKTGK